jgi:hypothetical protein
VRKLLKEGKSHGACNSVLSELRIEDRRGFKNAIRMTPTDFEELFVSPTISRKNASFRQAVPATDKLAVVLRCQSLGSLIRIFRASISGLIPEVINAIITALRKYVKA